MAQSSNRRSTCSSRGGGGAGDSGAACTAAEDITTTTANEEESKEEEEEDEEEESTDETEQETRRLEICWKITKRGKLRKIVREIYLREDISCGVDGCCICYNTPEKSTTTAAARAAAAAAPRARTTKRLDYLSSDDLSGDETVEERDLRATLAAAKWLQRHIRAAAVAAGVPDGPAAEITLLTNDRAVQTQAQQLGIDAMTLRQYAEDMHAIHPHAAEKLAYLVDEEEEKKNVEERSGSMAGRWKKRERNPIFSEHLKEIAIATRLRAGSLLKGKLRMLQDCCWRGIVIAGGEEIRIRGRADLNRAMEGDIVAVEVLQEEEKQQLQQQKEIEISTEVCCDNSEERKEDREQQRASIKEEIIHSGIGIAETTSKEVEVATNIMLVTTEQEEEEEEEERGADILVVDEETAIFPSGDMMSDTELEKYELMEEQKEKEEEERKEKKKNDEKEEKERDHRKIGKIVGIIRKGRREFCGTIRPFDNIYRADAAAARSLVEAVFIPSDRRIPNILIKTRRYEELANQRLVVVVDGWDRYSRYPRGHWTEVLGEFGSAEAEAAVILREHGVISRDFSLSSLRCLPPSTWEVKDLPQEERNRRLDLRHICVCSIDPPGCKDIDDALSLEILPNNNFRLGVHIADVTYYLREGTALDQEAAERCTTVYLVERRTDMLPPLLTTDLCSLVANRDRLAFSVFWEITREGDILSSSISKTIIHSRAALTYAESQSIIDDVTDQTELAQNLRHLMNISKALRSKRMQQGALQLASPDVQIIRETIIEDAAAAAGEAGGTAAAAGAAGAAGAGAAGGERRTGKEDLGETKSNFHAEEVLQSEVSDITLYQARDTNRMVEDMMLLANITVAQRIIEAFPTASLLRRHPDPKEKQLKSLKELLKRTGIEDFNFTSSKELSASLSRVAEQAPALDFLVRVLTTRCMEQAVYFSTAATPQGEDISSFDYKDKHETIEKHSFFHHYGLATPIYTHFTSPIRRYADVIVHRLLAAAEGLAPAPAISLNKLQLSQQCEMLNLKHRNAQLAGRSSVQYYVFRYFKTQGEKEAVGVITKIKRNGFMAYIHKYGLEGIAFVKEEAFAYNSEQQHLLHKQTGEILAVFDQVILRVAASHDNFRPTVNMTYLRKRKEEQK